MQFQCESLSRDPLSFADSKFHNYSTSTNLYPTDDDNITNQSKEQSQHIDNIAAENNVSINSTRLACETDCLPFASEVVQITQRFERIQQILLRHSQRQSFLHQKVYAFKEMAVDWNQLYPDFTNKINIVEDLRHLVGVAEKDPASEDIKELLESKFQEYYLERHYGGLKCEVNDLSIQERGEESMEQLQPNQQERVRQQLEYEQMGFGYGQQSSNGSACVQQLQCLSSVQRSDLSLEYINLKEDKYAHKEKKSSLNNIGGLLSLANESKLTYTQECCQTIEENYSISVEVPRFIEVEIPLIIYRVKEQVITYDQSDLQVPYKDIDQIIDKYSRPYEELFLDSNKQIQTRPQEDWDLLKFNSVAKPSTPLQSLQVGSIMLDSNVMDANRQPTQVELTYSHIPEEQLLLDSYAQIGSLISNTDHFSRSFRKDSMDSNTIVITEKLNSHSIIEKFEESERLLNEENLELKEKVVYLQEQLDKTEKKLKETAALNKKLGDRLEEEIDQGIYLAKKLDELDAELLEEKVSCLTRLNECKDNKIESLTAEVKEKVSHLQVMRCQLASLTLENEKTEEFLSKREEEVAMLSRQLEQRYQELCEFNSCEEDMIKIVSETEISLKCEIEKLEQEKLEMHDKITEFQKRLEAEGLSLQYEEAKEIQGFIQSREHVFSVELKEMTDKYEEIISGYKTELEEAKQQVRILNELNQAKSQLHDTCTTVKEKRLSESYLNEFEAIIEEYDHELQAKDGEILQLKQSLLAKQHLEQANEEEDFTDKAIALINSLSAQLEKEIQERMRITEKLIAVDKLVNSNKAMQDEQEQEKYELLVEQLTDRLQKVINENSLLKEKMLDMKRQKEPSQIEQIQALRKDVSKLRKVNSKLKKYTLQMESQLISISGMNRCESHKLILANITAQRNYYVELLAG